jgi:hypothetical protein
MTDNTALAQLRELTGTETDRIFLESFAAVLMENLHGNAKK